MVLGLAIWFWVSRSALKIIAVILSTIIAWVAAKITAEYAFGAIQHMLEEIAAPGCKEFGAFENWARVVMPGTVLGILLELSAKDDKFALHLGTLLPLFLGWQMTVAAIIGYCIVTRTGDGKLAPH